MRRGRKMTVALLVMMSLMMSGCNETTSFVTNDTTATVAGQHEDSSLLIYTPNANSDGFLVEIVHKNKRTANTVLKALQEKGVVPSNVQIRHFEKKQENGKQLLVLDVSKQFLSYINKMGTSQESLVMQGIANTYLIAFDANRIQITVNDKVIETGHMIYEEPFSFQIMLPNNVDKMTPVFDSLMRYMVEHHTTYQKENPNFLWGALFYLASGYGQLEDSSVIKDGTICMTKEAVNTFANALSNKNESLPDIPKRWKENIHYQKNKKTYTFTLGDIGATETNIIQCEVGEQEGSYVVYAKLLDPNDNATLHFYRFVIVPMKSVNVLKKTDDKQSLFPYTVIAAKEIVS